MRPRQRRIRPAQPAAGDRRVDSAVERPPQRLENQAPWHAGKWDSTVYNLIEKPRTIALRVEVTDNERHDPVAGVEVRLKGKFVEELKPRPDDVAASDVPKEQEFRLIATTGKDGVAIFALSWQKEYPWRAGLDEIEKVQTIEFRHPRYQFAQQECSFGRFLEVGQDKTTRMQDPKIFEAFEKAWAKEIDRPGVIFCLLELGTKFKVYENKSLDSEEFFQKIRDKDFGKVYAARRNMFTKGDAPQSLCGPYFIYPVSAVLQKKEATINIKVNGDTADENAAPSSGSSPQTPAPVNSDLEKGHQYYDQQKYDEAFRLFRKAAEAGDGKAINDFAWMFQHGLGTDTDPSEAAKWYRKSVDAGCSNGMYNLGLYQEGLGLKKDLRLAAQWYRKGADAGHPDAMFNLACAYSKGDGVAKDQEEAVKWLQKAADAGQEKAKQTLADLNK